MRHICGAILVTVAVLGLAFVAGSESPSGGFSELYRVDIAGTDDLEVVMGIIERSDRLDGGRHFHPGGEFGFILEGLVIVETDGATPQTLRAGASFHQPPGKWHVVSTGEGGAKTVVFRVLKKGDPMIVKVDTEL